MHHLSVLGFQVFQLSTHRLALLSLLAHLVLLEHLEILCNLCV